VWPAYKVMDSLDATKVPSFKLFQCPEDGLTNFVNEEPLALSKDEARRIAANIAKLRELLTRQSGCIMKRGHLLNEPAHAM
jgi:hypothetical protein